MPGGRAGAKQHHAQALGTRCSVHLLSERVERGVGGELGAALDREEACRVRGYCTRSFCSE